MTSADSESSRSSSLQRRVVVAFGLSGFLLTCLFGMVVFALLHFSEDRVLAKILGLELEEYLEHLEADPRAEPPQSPWLNSSFDPGAPPDVLGDLSALPDGFYELRTSPWNRDYELSYRIHTLEPGRRLYIWVDASQVEILDDYLGFMGLALLLAVAGITAIGVVLGRATAHRVIAPVVELAERVQAGDPADPKAGEEDLGQGFANDEVGLLARAFQRSRERSRAFLDRERRFTRDASHELRSPVTVVRGAVELLEARPEAQSPGIRRPLARIRRAADDMSNLIEAFLWLAREADGSDAEPLELRGQRHLAAEVEATVERYRYLLGDKPVALRIEVDPEATVSAPDGVLDIVIGNLVSNALFYTRQGQVVVGGGTRGFWVEDTGPGIPEARRRQVLQAHHRGRDSRGFGLGLAICRDLCTRFGWQLEISAAGGSASAGGTLAQVTFDSGSSAARSAESKC